MNLLFQKIADLYAESADIKNLFSQIALPVVSSEMTLGELLDSLADQFFRDSGLTRESLLSLMENIIAESKKESVSDAFALSSLAILGGFDKDGTQEDFSLELRPGDCYAVTGLTGSGKTQFLEDIEYIALGDSPSQRKILINGKFPSENERASLENHLCATLSQSMNFVMELSAEDFISMHIDCRKSGISPSEKESLVADVIDCANSLAGESIFPESVITQLSGGQSRALMISDIAFVSDAPVILIDEPENAGIDKNKIFDLLSAKGKIVLVSTHDPVIALSCRKRILIKNGGVSSILSRTAEEEKVLEELRRFDSKLREARNCIREGSHVRTAR